MNPIIPPSRDVAIRSQPEVWQNRLLNLLAPAAANPFSGMASENPITRAFVDVGFVGQVNLNLLGQDKMFGAAGQPLHNWDWPNPRGPEYAIELRTWTNSTKLNLIGQDTFFAAAGMGPSRDWPNPRGAEFPSILRTFSCSLNLELLGKDQFFGVAGEPLSPVDWPVPIAAPRASDLVAFSSMMSLGLAGSVALIIGPLCVSAAQNFVPGATAGQNFVPGASSSQNFVPGATAGLGGC